ncbi:hypothetical protein DPX16_16089 [Anabarilius grahami]|uniref:Uncharacterized protein n=1 Tax=Anabarilius grahami TaxID=495550 RepID=A0A3N0YND0_ANAGA|nr:hypothetical protein DPX16_16089 [Anabarilius grahami]
MRRRSPSGKVREPPTVTEEELLNILTEAMKYLGLDWSPQRPALFFLEVHDEILRSWRSPIRPELNLRYLFFFPLVDSRPPQKDQEVFQPLSRYTDMWCVLPAVLDGAISGNAYFAIRDSIFPGKVGNRASGAPQPIKDGSIITTILLCPWKPLTHTWSCRANGDNMHILLWCPFEPGVSGLTAGQQLRLVYGRWTNSTALDSFSGFIWDELADPYNHHVHRLSRVLPCHRTNATVAKRVHPNKLSKYTDFIENHRKRKSSSSSDTSVKNAKITAFSAPVRVTQATLDKMVLNFVFAGQAEEVGVQQGIQKRFGDVMKEPELIAAAILLPRFRTSWTTEENILNAGLDYIRNHLDTDLDDITSTNSSLSDEDDFFVVINTVVIL